MGKWSINEKLISIHDETFMTGLYKVTDIFINTKSKTVKVQLVETIAYTHVL